MGLYFSKYIYYISDEREVTEKSPRGVRLVFAAADLLKTSKRTNFSEIRPMVIEGDCINGSSYCNRMNIITVSERKWMT